jgi:hypothetical protein
MMPLDHTSFHAVALHHTAFLRLGTNLWPAGSLPFATTFVERPRPVGLRRPNLFLIGAMKAGTTYLNKLLAAHPAVFMCSPEEPSYFVDPQQLRQLWPDAWDDGYWRSEESYLRLFDGAGKAFLVGEASTNYTKRPLVAGVAERIHAFGPDARFVYLMRDPIERTISHYWHMVRFHAERRAILEAVRAEPHYLEVSHYAMQLRPYLDLFGHDRVIVLTFEQLTAAPEATMRWLYGELGLDGGEFDVSGFWKPENVTPQMLRMAAGNGALRRLWQSRPFRLLTPHLPAAVREFGLRLSTTPVRRDAVATGDLVDFLRPLQRRQTEELSQLLGRSFPEWTTLHGGNTA